MLKPIFPYILLILMPFPRFRRLSVTKKTNATFFSVGGSICEKLNLVKLAHVVLAWANFCYHPKNKALLWSKVTQKYSLRFCNQG